MDRPDDAKPLAPHPKPRVRAAAACSSHDKPRPRESGPTLRKLHPIVARLAAREDEAEEMTENSTP